jgi:Cof subfamily protein (haloacid dehalogenase superfamily)
MRAVALRDRGATAPRLLACDLDGTLLDETGALRPTVQAAIRAVRAAGVEVILATGRNHWAVTETARLLELPGPHIVMNGGAYVSPVSGVPVWVRKLDPELVVEALAFARALGAEPLLGFLHGHACERCSDGSPTLPDFAVGSRLRAVDSLEALADLGPVRVYMPTPPAEHARMVARAVDRFGGRASIVAGDEFGMEVMAPRTNKGEALRAVAASMRIAPADVAAIGDAPNDREMLAFAGRSAALTPNPGRASGDSILSYAAEVFPSSSRDGAVVAMRRFFPELDLAPDDARPAPAGRLGGRSLRLAPAGGSETEPDLSAA